jgi:hypothetical protein
MREETDFDASHGDALRIDSERRYWEDLVAKHFAGRQALPVADQVFNIGELDVFVRGGTVRGREAWAALYQALAALATLREVTQVAPEFESHLRAAAECLLPFMRNAPEVESGCGPGALTPLGDAMREQSLQRARQADQRNALLQKLLGSTPVAAIHVDARGLMSN